MENRSDTGNLPAHPDTAWIAIATTGHETGHNRAEPERQQIAARNDPEAVSLWLAEYHQSPHTLRAYRKEALRLMAWARQQAGKPLSGLGREDLLAYEYFLAHPAADWITDDLPRHGEQRRLFAGPLSPGSIEQALGILSSLFGYLVEAGYLRSNPLALRRKTGRRERPRSVERYLEAPLWQQVLDFIETLPQTTRREQQHYERARWVFRLLYGTALRVSEAAAARAGDLRQRRGRWWLRVCGKGQVVAEVPVTEILLADFSRYRCFNGLPPLPGIDEETPLILSVTGRNTTPLTASALYLIVKEVFRRAAAALADTDPAGASRLQQASTHWLRHTSATHQADAGNDLRHIRQNLRHASIETTSLYLHVEDDARHDATSQAVRFTPKA